MSQDKHTGKHLAADGTVVQTNSAEGGAIVSEPEENSQGRPKTFTLNDLSFSKSRSLWTSLLIALSILIILLLVFTTDLAKQIVDGFAPSQGSTTILADNDQNEDTANNDIKEWSGNDSPNTAASNASTTPGTSTPAASAEETTEDTSQDEQATLEGQDDAQNEVQDIALSEHADQNLKFGLLRVEQNGDYVFAGQATEDDHIFLMEDGEIIASSKDSESGHWSIYSEQPLAQGEHDLTLFALDNNGEVKLSMQKLNINVPQQDSSDEPNVEVAGMPVELIEQQLLQAKNAVASGASVVAVLASDSDKPSPTEATDEINSSETENTGAETSALNSNTTDVEENGSEGVNTSASTETSIDGTKLTIDSLDIDETGQIRISGQTPLNTNIALIIGNQTIDEVRSNTTTYSFSKHLAFVAGEHRVLVVTKNDEGKVLQSTAGTLTIKPQATGEAKDAALKDDVDTTELISKLRGKSDQDGTIKSDQDDTIKSDQDGTIQDDPGQDGSKQDKVATTSDMNTGSVDAKKPETETATARSTEYQESVTDNISTTQIIFENEAGETFHISSEQLENKKVIRGDNLWNLSRSIYGKGIRYQVIFAANKDVISDPDKIYPGQVFIIPKIPANLPDDYRVVLEN